MQMVIACSIIEKSKDDFLVVILFSQSSDKGKYYSERLAKYGTSIFFLPRTNHRPEALLNLLTIKYKLWIEKLGKFKSCYVASIDNIYIHYILGKIKFNVLYTYDDGMANIADNSIYYRPEFNPLPRKLLRKIFKIGYKMSTIKDMSKCHFTIYNGLKNIIENTFYISLFDYSRVRQNGGAAKFDADTIIRIFVGQPLFVVRKDYDVRNVEKKIAQLNIDFYYPHPFERVMPTKIPVIESRLIFEEYLMATIHENPTTKFEIYSFGSSVLLNIKDFPNVTLFYIYDINLSDKLHTIYSLYEQIGVNKLSI
ncbi:glycosyltransferase family 52 [Arachidicoccus rhizosphaerae]|nr:glycosyltransferase family 52 [Arachidicoccus rhizosphaerae]